MYFEGISACVSLTTKHVYCVTPCQLNRLLLFLVTIVIKIGRSASRRSACSTPSFSGNVKSHGCIEGGVSEARTTNRARGGQALEVLVHHPLRQLVSTRPGRHQRAWQQSRGLHVTLANFRSTLKSGAQDFLFVIMTKRQKRETKK